MYVACKEGQVPQSQPGYWVPERLWNDGNIDSNIHMYRCHYGPACPNVTHPYSCAAGYTGTSDVDCRACLEGTYKMTRGSMACENCAVGTYKLFIGPGNCTTCSPYEETRSSGSQSENACLCSRGYGWVGGHSCDFRRMVTRVGNTTTWNRESAAILAQAH